MALRKILAALGTLFSVPAQKIARIVGLADMLRIPHESEENRFERITKHDESWFQYSQPSSKMFVRSQVDAILGTREAIRTKKTMITIFVTRCKLIVLNILAKGSNSTNYILSITFFPICKGETCVSIVGSRMRFSNTDGQFDLPQWIKSGIKIREASCLTIPAPTRIARHEPLRLLAVWNVEGSLERPRV
jgi:hypothetical protein